MNRVPPGWIFVGVVALVMCILGGVIVSDLTRIITTEPLNGHYDCTIFQRLVQAMFG
jgi:hypothetical protein